jgi:hypothetical protein
MPAAARLTFPDGMAKQHDAILDEIAIFILVSDHWRAENPDATFRAISGVGKTLDLLPLCQRRILQTPRHEGDLYGNAMNGQ